VYGNSASLLKSLPLRLTISHLAMKGYHSV
jgi:hypothetical protein